MPIIITEVIMTEIKPKYKMSLNEAVNKKMDDKAFEAYLLLHEVSITRRDD